MTAASQCEVAGAMPECTCGVAALPRRSLGGSGGFRACALGRGAIGAVDGPHEALEVQHGGQDREHERDVEQPRADAVGVEVEGEAGCGADPRGPKR